MKTPNFRLDSKEFPNRASYEWIKEILSTKEGVQQQMEHMMKEGSWKNLEPLQEEPTVESFHAEILNYFNYTKKWVLRRAIQEGLWHPDEPII